MTLSPTIRKAFADPPCRIVTLTAQGFAYDEEEEATIEGVITEVTLLRKRFEQHRLICHSRDGLRSKDGESCEQCKHARQAKCRPRLRIRLQNQEAAFLLELAYSSARNFIAFADSLKAQNRSLETTVVELSIIDRGSWGEVEFTPLP